MKPIRLGAGLRRLAGMTHKDVVAPWGPVV
jgi:hypothetical protein